MQYKTLLLIPVALLVVSVAFLVNNYSQTGEWFSRSVELKGGVIITLSLSEKVDITALEKSLSFPVSIKELTGFTGYSIQIETPAETNTTELLQAVEDFGVDTTRSSVMTMGPGLGQNFWSQAQIAIIVAFIFMGIIVFGIFRKFIPSFAVMACAVSDIIVTLAVMQVFGIQLSLAGMAAVLMLIGYSIDTDILLTTRLLKGTGSVVERVFSAMKTGLTMSLTTVGALTALLLVGLSPVLSQIATVLLIGILLDICNTWLQNSVLLRWYCEREGL